MYTAFYLWFPSSVFLTVPSLAECLELIYTTGEISGSVEEPGQLGQDVSAFSMNALTVSGRQHLLDQEVRV